MSSGSWKKMGSAVIDWIDSKTAKTLRVSNDRESFQLKKLRRSLETMKTLNDNLLKQEERKIKKKLAKLTDISLPGTYQSLYKKPSSATSLQRQHEETRPSSAKHSTETSGTQYLDHLPKLVNFLQQPSRRLSSTEEKKSKGYVPFSSIDLTMSTTAPRPPDGSRAMSYSVQGSSNVARKGTNARTLNQELSNISIQEAMTIFPPLQKLSSLSGKKWTRDKIHLHEAVSGIPTFERRLKKLLVKAWEEESSKRVTCLPYIRPDEVLRCRYLRLSDNNISTLLQLCKEMGLHVDLHPHMKESDIDISTIMSSAKLNTVSL